MGSIVVVVDEGDEVDDKEKCHGRMRLLGAITQRATITKILEHLGLPVDPPPVERGRDPTWSEAPPREVDL